MSRRPINNLKPHPAGLQPHGERPGLGRNALMEATTRCVKAGTFPLMASRNMAVTAATGAESVFLNPSSETFIVQTRAIASVNGRALQQLQQIPPSPARPRG
jgi:hypothetical protein